MPLKIIKKFGNFKNLPYPCDQKSDYFLLVAIAKCV